MRYLKFYILLLVVSNGLICFSQNRNFEYSPKNIDSLQKYIAAATLKRTAEFANDKKEIQKILNRQQEAFLKDLADSTYIFDNNVNNYVKSIFSEIFAANPSIASSNFYFLIDKSPVPNAACWGNGIFTVNLGLLNMVENDDELAFIVCHEIAHQVLKHNDKSLLSHVQRMNSKDTKKKISLATRQRYGRRQAVYGVMKDLNYDFLKRSRSAETEADSLGFVFFSNTRFNKSAGARVLKKLDLSDTMLFATDIQLKKHFDFEEYPFKETWIAPGETLFDLKEKSDDYAWDKDSLKSHPDIPLRIEKLEKLLNNGQQEKGISNRLETIKEITSRNSIAVSVDDSRIDLALYQILELYSKNKIERTDYCNMVGKILKKTYELKLAHHFGKYVSPVSPFSEEKYLNEVRLFLHNIEVKNVRKIGLQFCMQHQKEMDGNSEFNDLTAFFTNINPNK